MKWKLHFCDLNLKENEKSEYTNKLKKIINNENKTPDKALKIMYSNDLCYYKYKHNKINVTRKKLKKKTILTPI